MTMSLKTKELLLDLLTLLVATAALALLAGCYVANPGKETAAGLTQQKTYQWMQDGSYTVNGIGPQEEAFTMAEGEIVLNEDGTIKQDESHLTHYLRSEPSADEAAQTMAAIMLANVEQSKQLNKFADRLLTTLEQLMPLLPGIVGNSQPTEGEDTNARADLLGRLEKLLEERDSGGG